MSMAERFALAIPLALVAGMAFAADGPGLGKPVSEADLAKWDLSIGPDGKMWLFHFVQEVKSFITHPSFGHSLNGPGYYEISGIAYSGNGRISKVMVSADGGKSWAQAGLDTPVLSKALTRFRAPWRWDGQPVVLQSRAWDEAGNVQPTRAEFVAARGQTERPVASPLAFPNQHYNSITSWGIDGKGEIKHVYA